MVELESENETTKLSSKINVLNKNVKALMFSIDKLMEKLDNTKPVEKTPEEEKERIDKIFEKKQIGHPSGTFDTKRVQYLKMLNENKIKQPKQQTLEYYGIQKDGDMFLLCSLFTKFSIKLFCEIA